MFRHLIQQERRKDGRESRLSKSNRTSPTDSCITHDTSFILKIKLSELLVLAGVSRTESLFPKGGGESDRNEIILDDKAREVLRVDTMSFLNMVRAILLRTCKRQSRRASDEQADSPAESSVDFSGKRTAASSGSSRASMTLKRQKVQCTDGDGSLDVDKYIKKKQIVQMIWNQRRAGSSIDFHKVRVAHSNRLCMQKYQWISIL